MGLTLADRCPCQRRRSHSGTHRATRPGRDAGRGQSPSQPQKEPALPAPDPGAQASAAPLFSRWDVDTGGAGGARRGGRPAPAAPLSCTQHRPGRPPRLRARCRHTRGSPDVQMLRKNPNLEERVLQVLPPCPWRWVDSHARGLGGSDSAIGGPMWCGSGGPWVGRGQPLEPARGWAGEP